MLSLMNGKEEAAKAGWDRSSIFRFRDKGRIMDRSKILLIDDREENLLALERILADLDVELVRASAGREALALARDQEFAMALVDAQMPEMGGYETVKLLHQEMGSEPLPVIFVSPLIADEYHQLKGIESGAIDFLEKPLHPLILKGKVRQFLKLYESRQLMEKANQLLENRVMERTASLVEVNEELKNEIRERQELELRMRQVQKMEALGTMAGGIAHDFNNILAIIQLNAAMAIDNLSSGETADEELQEILDATSRARDLTMKILTFSHKHERKAAVVCLLEIIKDSARMLRSVIPTSIELIMNLAEECNPVCVDPLDIHQVMMNLCINSSQAMDEKGTLRIVLREVELQGADIDPASELQPGRYVRLTVADTGCGIEENIREKIFDPFFTTKQSGQGTGMGLAVVYGIVQSYKGQVTMESEKGKGTAFHLFFPVAERLAAAENQKEDTPKAAKSVAGSERILFVDDEKELAALGKRIMEKNGYQVSFFSSSPEALRAFREAPDGFDIVITDHNMPKMTGIDLAREIFKIRSHIPIILCTGYTSKVSTRNFRQYGFRELLTKPYNQVQLLTAVRSVADGLTGRSQE